MSQRRTVVGIEGLADVIQDGLFWYSERIHDGLRAEGRRCVKDLVKATKATAPVGNRNRHYRDDIKSKEFINRRTVRFVWYVDGPNYRLSHLLENGHANRDGGRTPGTHFIEKASEPILEEYVRAVEEVIKNS